MEQHKKGVRRLFSQANRMRMARRLHWKLPALFPDPAYAAKLARAREDDDQENEQTSPPEDEQICLHALTVAELYGPSQVDALCRRLDSLGWRDAIAESRDPVEWIKRGRDGSSTGSWFNLGVLTRPGDKRFLAERRFVDLPDDVDYASGQIFCLTPSITCLVVRFIYTDAYALSLDAALRKKRQTAFTRVHRGYRYNKPRFEKQRDVERIRIGGTEQASAWFTSHLPGLFAGGLLDGQHPCIEMLTLAKAKPFEASQRGYLYALGLDRGFDVWRSKTLEGLVFASTSFRDTHRFHACLSINLDDLHTVELEAWGGRCRHGYTNYLDDDTNTLLSRWALLALAAGIERSIHNFRDSMYSKAGQRKATQRTLTTMSQFISSSMDRAMISADISQFAKQRGLFLLDFPKMLLEKSRFNDHDKELGESIGRQLELRATSLNETNRAVSDLLAQQGSMLSATESIKLQHRVDVMTWVMVVLTIVTTVFSALSAYEPLTKIFPALAVGR